ncbi:MAG: alanyl-tRNA editing protein [Acidimicrobiia bacterium]
MTVKIYSTDAYAREMQATVTGVDADDGRILLDSTVFYPGGGGQPHDIGELWIDHDRLEVTRVAEDADGVWHWVGGALPAVGTAITGRLDWERRYRLMQTHTAMHALCGVVWNRYHSPVTGGDMKPGEGRLDFDLPEWDPEDKSPLEGELNEQVAKARPVEVSFLPREEADRDPSLIRTKVSLLPAALRSVRVIDIVGLDRQADGGTHVASTGEVETVTVAKIESKGKGFRRIRLTIAG